jgi:hypothetical protein
MFKNVQPWNIQSLKGLGALNYIGLGTAVLAILLEAVAGI